MFPTEPKRKKAALPAYVKTNTGRRKVLTVFGGMATRNGLETSRSQRTKWQSCPRDAELLNGITVLFFKIPSWSLVTD